MLLQTNSYIVPKDKRTQHSRLVLRFRQTLMRLGCDHFEAYEQVGANWSPADTTGRFVQLMRFRDRKHQLAVQGAERNDPTAQALIKEFCELINFPYQQQQGLFAVGFYHSLLPALSPRLTQSGGDDRVEENAAATQDASDNEAQSGETRPMGHGVIEPHAFDQPIIESAGPHPISGGEIPFDDEPIDGELSGEISGEISDADALLDEMESSESSSEPHIAPMDRADELGSAP